MKIALATDFARFDNLLNAKALIQPLQNKLSAPSHPITRAASHT
jgi:hypothetical protein